MYACGITLCSLILFFTVYSKTHTEEFLKLKGGSKRKAITLPPGNSSRASP